MFLLSMTLAPNYKQYGLWNRVGLGTLLTDETFGVAIRHILKVKKLMIVGFMVLISQHIFFGLFRVWPAPFSANIFLILMPWIRLCDTAMFIFLGISQFESVKNSRFRIYIILIICVITMMLLLSLVMPSYVAILIAATFAAALGVVMDK